MSPRHGAMPRGTGPSSRTHGAAEPPSHDPFMGTLNPIPPPPEDPARDLLSYIPVFETVVGMGALLAATGVAIAVVPALRRRRDLPTKWALIVSAFLLTVLGSGLWILSEPSMTDNPGVAPALSEPLSLIAIGLVLLAVAPVTFAAVPALRRRHALVMTFVLLVGGLLLAALVNLGFLAT